ncbi:bromodomain adjacent to zinc finger domain protein 1A-like isoform X2 [Daktulosphaira vitifoliae]|uniref:bromodomain adjacent to zinc finger domain protein 1A-like isoform X2 n=1 Tax=Daktulosphaira vitifoliae TaxID=58002 RepID=UPI0021AAE463|nr:bromodomain adjacent to zinc finger domain protein 1A-like isoform X2 [Daktulosphaira vitifoliae]
MPLLHKKPFSKNPVPRGLRDTDEVFYCEMTKEIFLNYEHYVERIILCNSLVWSCEITGKKNMTYKEALDCEIESKRMLNDFPNELQKPILFLLSLTKCSSLKELIEQIFNYVRYRYFISEIVEVALEQDQWLKCRVLAVHSPSDQKGTDRSRTPKKSNDSGQSGGHLSYSYDVELLNSPSKKGNPNNEPIYRVDAVQIKRSKNCFTRDRCRFFITHNVELKNGLILLKESVASQIANMKFEDIFSGEIPQFSETKKNKVLAKNGLVKKQELINGETSKKNEKTIQEVAEKIKEEKLRVKEKRKEEKEKLAKFMKEWSKKKEDLELEDLKELPVAKPVNLKIPNKLFGEFVMIYEFFQNFWSQLDAGSYFPQGLSIELLEKCIVESEVAGPLNTLIQVLLTTIFDLEEDEEADMKDSHISGSEPVYNICDEKIRNAIKYATNVKNWTINHLGQHLNKIMLQPTVISEVLRLHLLSSGGKHSEKMAKWMYQERGNYCPTDDPGFTLRLNRPDLLESLSHHHISSLSIADKMAILNCLMNQILTFSSYRIQLQNTVVKTRNARLEVRSAVAAEKKKSVELSQKKKEMKLLNGDSSIVESDQKAIEAKQNEWNKKLNELSELGMTAQILPLGTDRAFRRYWIFASMPGLFVEDYEPNPGTCLPDGTPVSNITDKDTVSYVKRLFEMNEKENVDETRTSLSNMPLKKKLVDSINESSFMSNGSFREDPKKSIYSCWGPDNNCPVHDENHDRLTWSYFNTPEELEILLENLNSRGLRESELKKTIALEKHRIISSMEKCTNCLLDPSMMIEDDKRIQKRLKTEFCEFKKVNVKFLRVDDDVDTSLELTLREYILDVERRLNTTALGNLSTKIPKRDDWRDDILSGIYEVEGHLSWGNRSKVVNINENEKDSSPEPLNYQDPINYVIDNVNINEKVTNLASIILILEQSVELKFLKRPLGYDKKEKMGVSAINPMLDKWELSLMSSVNFSQLFLHLITLEKSIEWSKSIMKVNCVLCRSNKDEDVMLLCDNCNRGHHIYCLKPKLKKIPSGDWYCQKCKPLVKNQSDEYEPEEKVKIDICHICKEEGSVITCDDCSKNYHLSCLNPPKRVPPKRNWTCFICRQTSCKDDMEQVEVERCSRRKSSQAATAKISEFARQLLHTTARYYEEENVTEEKSRRRARHSENTTLTTAGDLPLDNALLQLLLNQVMHHPDAWPFLRPVTKSQCPDYHAIIKNPMDLGTVKYKLNMLSYRTNEDLLSDMELIFENCFYYNSESSEVYKCGEEVYNYYKKLCQECNLKDFSEDGQFDGPPPKKSKHSF